MQAVSIEAGGPPSLKEGLSADGKNWEVRCNACFNCADGTLCHGYWPKVMIGSSKYPIRCSRAEYRRVKKTYAYGGRISLAIVSQNVALKPEQRNIPRFPKVTRGIKKQRKRNDCGQGVNYFVSLVISDIPVPAPTITEISPEQVVGIDPGARKFLTLSDGTVIPDLQVALDEFIRNRTALQRRLSRWHDPRCRNKMRGKKYEAVKKKYTEACAKIARMRRHMHEQIITQILDKPVRVFAVEDTALANITRSSKGTEELPAAYGQAKASRERNRKMLAQGIGGFMTRFCQRAKMVGKIVIPVNPAYTSQTCHVCKERHSELGSKEVFLCPSCGHQTDRDLNASCNIRDEGIAMIKKYGSPAVGGKYLLDVR